MDYSLLKAKVAQCVTSYKRTFPEEYAQFLKEQKVRRDGLADEKFAEVKGTDISVRHILEYPETLSMMIHQITDDTEELQWKEFEVQRWLANEYPEFRIPKKI